MSAQLQAERVCDWVKRNPRAFRAVMAMAHREVDAGNPRLTRDDAYAMLRSMRVQMADGDGEPCEIDLVRNHNFWACLSRYMVMLRPRLAKVLCFRKSMFDSIDLEQVWRENVNAGMTFLASSWQEAKRLVETKDAGAA